MMRAALPAQPYTQPAGALNLTVAAGILDVVPLDSSVLGASHGLLDTNTLGWLDATLGASTTRPAFLFLHHPPFLTGIGTYGCAEPA
jgi:hypothetical protein